MSVLEKFDESVDLAIKNGDIDAVKQGAIIEAARKVATVMDEDEWPIVRGKIDNVSPSVFLKYCDKLGLAPDIKIEKDTRKTDKNAKLSVVGGSKWKRA